MLFIKMIIYKNYIVVSNELYAYKKTNKFNLCMFDLQISTLNVQNNRFDNEAIIELRL